MNDEIKIITYRGFREQYCLSAFSLEFYGVASAIRSSMKNFKLKPQDGKE